MGSDGAPGAEVEGVLQAARASDASLLLVGDEEKIRERLGKKHEQFGSRIEIRHAPEVIAMSDHPSIAVKQKKQSSMRVCFDLVKTGEADALVSAGNSGAMMACGLFVLRRLPGVDRPAIITTFPTMRGPCALLDMGANVDTKPQVLAQFAVMGAVHSRLQHKIHRPKVGLLSNGSEEHKGSTLTRETHRLLQRTNGKNASFDYAGYIEGGDIFRGNVDVVVTDGFTGNVLLKGCEGLVAVIFDMAKSEIMSGSPLVRLGALLMKPALRSLAKRTDHAETGGAPLLGVNGVVTICHGHSDARAIKNAILQARHFAQSDLGQSISTEIANHEFIWAPEPANTDGQASGESLS